MTAVSIYQPFNDNFVGLSLTAIVRHVIFFHSLEVDNGHAICLGPVIFSCFVYEATHRKTSINKQKNEEEP
jgi:hypothetical protein